MQDNIKNLIVDFGGVLIDLNRTRCVEAFEKLDLNSVEELIDPYRQQGLFLAFEQGNITTTEFRDGIRKLAGKKITDKQIDAAWNSFLINIPSKKLDLLLSLRQHYVVYLLSNTNDIHWRWACDNCFAYKGFRVEDYFEDIYLSYEMHCAKPDKEIFETLIAETGILPEESFFIDDAQSNCLTAEALGIKTYMPQAGEDWSHLFMEK
ncbi:MAG: HAD family phosphatase [Bacteroidaceae bacterium]